MSSQEVIESLLVHILPYSSSGLTIYGDPVVLITVNKKEPWDKMQVWREENDRRQGYNHIYWLSL